MIVLAVLWMTVTVTGACLLLAVMGVQRLRSRTVRRPAPRRGAAVMG